MNDRLDGYRVTFARVFEGSTAGVFDGDLDVAGLAEVHVLGAVNREGKADLEHVLHVGGVVMEGAGLVHVGLDADCDERHGDRVAIAVTNGVESMHMVKVVGASCLENRPHSDLSERSSGCEVKRDSGPGCVEREHGVGGLGSDAGSRIVEELGRDVDRDVTRRRSGGGGSLWKVAGVYVGDAVDKAEGGGVQSGGHVVVVSTGSRVRAEETGERVEGVPCVLQRAQTFCQPGQLRTCQGPPEGAVQLTALLQEVNDSAERSGGTEDHEEQHVHG